MKSVETRYITMPPFVYTCASSFAHAQRTTAHVTHDADGKGCVVVNFAGNKCQRLFSSKEKTETVRDYYRGNSYASESRLFFIPVCELAQARILSGYCSTWGHLTGTLRGM